jgi:hypothetical protein
MSESRRPRHPRGAEISTLYGPTLSLFGVPIRPADVVILAGVVVFGLLMVIYHRRAPDAWTWSLKIALAGGIYFGAAYLYHKLSNPVARFFVRSAAVLGLCAFLFVAVLPLQLIWYRTWNDAAVLRLENRVFGLQPTVWLERFVSPALTEWMMFCYVIYLVIYPGLAALIRVRRGERAMEDYLFTLAVTNIVCFLGFLIYPVAGPMKFIPGAYSVPLKGGLFTGIAESIRVNVHGIGGTIPSPHCAIATVMWAMAFRYVRPIFYALAPVILSLYISTFYGRFHYITDSVIGIICGLTMFLAAPALARAWNAAVAARRGGA